MNFQQQSLCCQNATQFKSLNFYFIILISNYFFEKNFNYSSATLVKKKIPFLSLYGEILQIESFDSTYLPILAYDFQCYLMISFSSKSKKGFVLESTSSSLNDLQHNFYLELWDLLLNIGQCYHSQNYRKLFHLLLLKIVFLYSNLLSKCQLLLNLILIPIFFVFCLLRSFLPLNLIVGNKFLENFQP